MNETKKHSDLDDISTNSIAEAIFIVNKHAKTAVEPKQLYTLKRLSLTKLLQEGKAKKTGLHFSDNPRFAAQQSDVIVTCGAYIFHLPPTKEDFKELPHLGQRSTSIRNPKTIMSLSKAKQILQSYIGQANERNTKQEKVTKTDRWNKPQQRAHNPFLSTFLGKGSKY